MTKTTQLLLNCLLFDGQVFINNRLQAKAALALVDELLGLSITKMGEMFYLKHSSELIVRTGSYKVRIKKIVELKNRFNID